MFLFVTICSLLVSLVVASKDETLLERASGVEVVKATLAKIQAVCIFDNDNYFLRRLAYVETADGTDKDTFANSFYGGIWKIDEERFLETKSLSTDLYESINTHFEIEWKLVKWEELVKPLYSAIAAYLYVEYVKEHGEGLPIDLKTQSSYWETHFDQESGKKNFSIIASKIEKVTCEGSPSDVLFVVDGSGSIDRDDFILQKKYIVDFIKSYKFGSDPSQHTRFSLLQFSNEIKEEFNFNSYTTHKEYEKGVEKIEHMRKSTRTDLALEYVVDEAFDESKGARKSGVAKVVVVFTDGKSTYEDLTIEAAEKLLEKDITVFVIGIGSSLDEDELELIADDPDCLHLNYLSSYQQFENIKNNILSKTCKAPVEFDSENHEITIGGEMTIDCRIKTDKSGNTIEVQSDYSSENDGATFYFARNIIPSSSFYDFKFDIESSAPIHRYIPYDKSSKNAYIYCYIEGKSNHTVHLNISVETGEQTPCEPNPCNNWEICELQPSFSYVCKSDPAMTTTTTTTTPSSDSTSKRDCKTNNPCNDENIRQRKFMFIHHDEKKYIHCSEWESCWVMICPPRMIWNQPSLKCVWKT